MINIILYNEKSIFNIVKKSVKYFSKVPGLRKTEDTIWLNDFYISFYPKRIVINAHNPTVATQRTILNCLPHILLGEEVFISDATVHKKYLDIVTQRTNFDQIFQCDKV